MKVYKISVIILFFAIIITPALFMNRDSEKISVIENRRVAPMPSITMQNILNGSVLPQIEDYINDNIGFRQEMVLRNISLMYNTVKKIEVPNYLEGKEKHLFYITPQTLTTYQGLDYISEVEIKDICGQIEELDAVLESMDIEFLFAPIPNKEKIYGEYMPDGINIINKQSMLKSVAEYVSLNTEVNVTDMYGALLDKKEERGLLYYRNMDPTHWNMNGAFVGYTEIMKCLLKKDKNLNVLQYSDINVIVNEVNKPICYLSQYDEFASTFKDFYDSEYIFGYNYSGMLDNSVPEGFVYQNDSTNTYFHYANENLENRKTLLIFGDSYIYTFMFPFLSESFSDVFFLSNQTSALAKAELLQLVEPDVVIFEIVERMVYKELLSSYVCEMKDAFKTIASSSVAQEIITQGKTNGAESLLRFDNDEINQTQRITITDTTDKYLHLTGWAIDKYLDTAPKMIVAGVGGNIYCGEIFQRPDIATAKEEYLDCGFRFSIPLEDIQGAQYITFYTISESNTYSTPVQIFITNGSSATIKGGISGEFEPLLMFDNDLINQQHCLDVTAEDMLRLTGWCVDIQNNCSALSVIARVGNNEYSAVPYERPDIANGNDALINTGLVFEIPTAVLKEAEYIEFLVASRYEETKFIPLVIKINK